MSVPRYFAAEGNACSTSPKRLARAWRSARVWPSPGSPSSRRTASQANPAGTGLVISEVYGAAATPARTLQRTTSSSSTTRPGPPIDLSARIVDPVPLAREHGSTPRGNVALTGVDAPPRARRFLVVQQGGCTARSAPTSPDRRTPTGARSTMAARSGQVILAERHRPRSPAAPATWPAHAASSTWSATATAAPRSRARPPADRADRAPRSASRNAAAPTPTTTPPTSRRPRRRPPADVRRGCRPAAAGRSPAPSPRSRAPATPRRYVGDIAPPGRGHRALPDRRLQRLLPPDRRHRRRDDATPGASDGIFVFGSAPTRPPRRALGDSVEVVRRGHRVQRPDRDHGRRRVTDVDAGAADRRHRRSRPRTRTDRGRPRGARGRAARADRRLHGDQHLQHQPRSPRSAWPPAPSR